MEYEETCSLADAFGRIYELDPYFRDKEKKSDQEFYSEYYKVFLKQNGLGNGVITSDEDEEYEEIEVVELSKEDIMSDITEIVKIYQSNYKIPKVRISNNEWDMLFDKVFEYYSKHGYIVYYNEDMHFLNRLALSRAMLYEQKGVYIDDYIESISYLDNTGLTQSNQKQLKKVLTEEEKKYKIIQIQKYLKR